MRMFLPNDIGHLTYPGWKFPPHIQKLQNACLQLLHSPRINRLIVEMPVRHGKSVYGSITLPVWYLLTESQKSLIHLGAGADFINQFGLQIKQRIEKYGKQLTGVTLDPSMRRSDQFWLSNGSKYYGTGVGGQTQGRGAHLMVCDDLIKDNSEAASPDMRDKMFAWFHSEGLSRLEPGGKAIVIMSRRHPDDVIGRLLSSNINNPPEEYWHSIRYPALDDDNQALWPDRYSAQELGRIRDRLQTSGLDYLWECLYQQSPIGDPTQMAWPDEYFKDLWYDELPPDLRAGNRIKYTCIAVDPSQGKTDRIGDYTAILYIIVTEEDDIYVEDAILERLPQGRIADEVALFTKKHNPQSVVVEVNGFQQSVALLISQAYEREKVQTPLHWLETKIHKETKIRSTLSPVLHQRKLHLRRGLMGTKIIMKHLREFPTGSHDDGADALAIAYRHVFGDQTILTAA